MGGGHLSICVFTVAPEWQRFGINCSICISLKLIFDLGLLLCEACGSSKGDVRSLEGSRAAQAHGSQPLEARYGFILLPCTFFLAVMLFLEVFPNLQRSAFCSLQQNVCLLFVLTTKQNLSLMSVFNLYFLCVEFVGCFGQEQSYGTEYMLFYH